MGADQFSSIGIARTPEVAFNQAHDQATWEYGHGGYSGTIAEKGSYVLLGKLGSRYYDNVEDYFHELLYGDEKKIPAGIRDVIRRGAGIFNDKWGPAVCFEVVGTKAVAIKKRYGRGGTMDKVWLFTGYASS